MKQADKMTDATALGYVEDALVALEAALQFTSAATSLRQPMILHFSLEIKRLRTEIEEWLAKQPTDTHGDQP